MKQDDFIETYTGNNFYFNDIENSVINIKDIAWSLCQMPRYNGHTKVPWSVGQHSLLVLDLVEFNKTLMKYALLHDAAEAYLGDMVGPLKRHLPDFKRIEKQVEDHIYRWFGMEPRLPPAVKYADLQALGIEKNNFMNPDSHWPCLDGVEIPDRRLTSLQAKHIYPRFLDVWATLEGE